MMAPSPNCFSIWATVVLRFGLASNIESASFFSLVLVRGVVFLAICFLFFVFVAVTMEKNPFSWTEACVYVRTPGSEHPDSISVYTTAIKSPWAIFSGFVYEPVRGFGDLKFAWGRILPHDNG